MAEATFWWGRDRPGKIRKPGKRGDSERKEARPRGLVEAEVESSDHDDANLRY